MNLEDDDEPFVLPATGADATVTSVSCRMTLAVWL